LVKGTDKSRLFCLALCISERGQDRVGNPLHILSRGMRGTFGDFGGKLSLQRSPPRWIDRRFVASAADFVLSLS
jgi:hypothetical protein